MWMTLIKIGVFWDGPTFLLCRGPRWWCDLRARFHLILHPYRRATVCPKQPLDEDVIVF